jgi:kynurenine aminotransferase
MTGGKIVYVPLQPPTTGIRKLSSADWKADTKEIAKAITPKTKMIVSGSQPDAYCSLLILTYSKWKVINTPYVAEPLMLSNPLLLPRNNPLGKIFTREELQGIGELCVQHNILILSDEVSSPSTNQPTE